MEENWKVGWEWAVWQKDSKVKLFVEWIGGVDYFQKVSSLRKKWSCETVVVLVVVLVAKLRNQLRRCGKDEEYRAWS